MWLHILFTEETLSQLKCVKTVVRGSKKIQHFIEKDNKLMEKPKNGPKYENRINQNSKQSPTKFNMTKVIHLQRRWAVRCQQEWTVQPRKLPHGVCCAQTFFQGLQMRSQVKPESPGRNEGRHQAVISVETTLNLPSSQYLRTTRRWHVKLKYLERCVSIACHIIHCMYWLVVMWPG